MRGPPPPSGHPVKRITPPALRTAPPKTFDLDDWEGEDSRQSGAGGSGQVQVYIDDFDEEEGGIGEEGGGQGGGGDTAGATTTGDTLSDRSSAVLVDGDGDDDWM